MSKTQLNIQLRLRRDSIFSKTYILEAGEPGFEISTNTLKIGDGSTNWENLPIANKSQIDALIKITDDKFSNYKQLQDVIAAVETSSNTFIDTIAQDANGKITITTKSVDFTADDERSKTIFKQIQEAIAVNQSATNLFVDTIGQDAQGKISVTFKAVDFSDYRKASDQDLIDATFKVKQTAYSNNGSELKTITEVTQNENGEISVTYADIKTGQIIENETGLVTGDTAFKAIESVKSIIDGISSAGLTRAIVESLPDPSTAAMNTIYMIHRAAGLDAQDVYDEYILVDVSGVKSFELIGNTELDLSNYYTKDEIDGKNFKVKQSSYTAAGADKKTVTNISQNANGEIEVVYSDIDFSHEHDSQYKKLQEAISASETDANTFIYGVDQDENGVISIHTKAVDFTATLEAAAKDASDKAAVVLAEAQKYSNENNTTYTVSATANPLELTLTPSAGDPQTITLVAPDTGVMNVEAGNDIEVTSGENGVITVSHESFTTGAYTRDPATSDKDGDQYFFTSVLVDNGHVTGANVKSLAAALEGMSFIFDGGTSE